MQSFYECDTLSCKEWRTIVKCAVYITIGIDMAEHKDDVCMYVGQNESAKFWLFILNSLKNNVRDILIFCIDGLSGFPQAIEAVSRIQKRKAGSPSLA